MNLNTTFPAASAASLTTSLPSSIPAFGLQSSTSQAQLIPQTERLFTLLPRNSLAGEQENFASLYVKNYTPAKSTKYTSLYGLQKAVTQAQGFSSFLLSSYSFQQTERYQLTPVFGGGIAAYFFGQNPILLNLSGNIPDDIDNQWFLQFATAYQEFLRGSQLARRYETMVFLLPNMTVEGAILNLSYSNDASRWVDIPFECTILVRSLSYRPVIFGGTLNAPQLFSLSSTPNSSLSFSAINGLRSAMGSLGIGAAVPTENIAAAGIGVPTPANSVASLLNGASTPANSSASVLVGAATPANAAAALLAGAPTPFNGFASLGVSSTLMNLQSSLMPGSNGSLGGASSWLTNAFSSVSGFLKTLSGYITDVQTYVSNAITNSGIGGIISLAQQAGADLGSIVGSVSALVGSTAGGISSIIGEIASIPGDILTPFEAPLANLATLKGTFTNFIDQLIALPNTLTSYEMSTMNQFVSAVVPLMSPPLFSAGSGTNAMNLMGAGAAGLGAGAGMGTGAAGLGAGTGASLGSGTAPASNPLSPGIGITTPPNQPALL